jgi:hypothetical protein
LRIVLKKIMTGRPSKLTPKVQNIVLEGIKLGLTYEKVANLANVSRVTLRNWFKTGQKAKSGPFFDFFNALQKAEAEGEMRNLEKIRQASLGGQKVVTSKEIYRDNQLLEQITTTKKAAPDWRAAAWILERRYPERWGKNKLNIDQTQTSCIDRDIYMLAKHLLNMPRHQLKKIASRLKEEKF